MGYFVYISKADHPVRSKAVPITAREWRDAVATDPDLEFETRAVRSVVWYDELGDDRGRLAFHAGRVLAKNPSDDLVKKMVALAKEFGGRVVGDDGQVYS